MPCNTRTSNNLKVKSSFLQERVFRHQKARVSINAMICKGLHEKTNMHGRLCSRYSHIVFTGFSDNEDHSLISIRWMFENVKNKNIDQTFIRQRFLKGTCKRAYINIFLKVLEIPFACIHQQKIQDRRNERKCFLNGTV